MDHDAEVTQVNARAAASALIDGVRLEQHVASGLSSEVYRGTNLVANRPCAVKLVRPELAVSAVRRGRFIHEAERVAALGHAGVADVFRFGVAADGRSYALAEWVEGQSLRALVRGAGPMSRRAFLPLMRQLGAVVGAIHAAGTVHRRLHGGNIMIVDAGGERQLKLLDFGVWHLHPALDDSEALPRTAEQAMTLAPELVRGQEHDARSDVYALGVLLYEMVTGKVPFLGNTFAETLEQHVNDDPLPPSQVVAMPSELENAIMRALEKDPKKRTPSAEALLSALDPLGVSTQHAPASRSGSTGPRGGGGAVRMRELTTGEMTLDGRPVGPGGAAGNGSGAGGPGAASAGGPDGVSRGSAGATVDHSGGADSFAPLAADAAAAPAPISAAPLVPPKRKAWLFIVLGVTVLLFGGAMVWMLVGDDAPKKKRRRRRRQPTPRRVIKRSRTPLPARRPARLPVKRPPAKTAPKPAPARTPGLPPEQPSKKKPASKTAGKRLRARVNVDARRALLARAKRIRGFGQIIVISRAAGAQFFLDGHFVGRGSRKALPRVPVGKHRLHVVVGGKRSPSKDVTLSKGARVTVTF